MIGIKKILEDHIDYETVYLNNNGKLHGMATAPYPNGNIWYQHTFVNGWCRGMCKNYNYYDGELHSIDIRKDDVFNGIKIWFINNHEK